MRAVVFNDVQISNYRSACNTRFDGFLRCRERQTWIDPFMGFAVCLPAIAYSRVERQII